MLATLIDFQLSLRGQTRRCFVNSLGVRDIDKALSKLDEYLQQGTDDKNWLERLAEQLGLEKDKVYRANRVTLLMRKRFSADQDLRAFTPYIEFVLEGYDEPDSLMNLTKDQWAFKLKEVNTADARDFAAARRLYKQKFIEYRGRSLGRKIVGFRYFWSANEALEFDIYGYCKQIVAVRPIPKKRFVSRRVLRAVGKPRLQVIHS